MNDTSQPSGKNESWTKIIVSVYLAFTFIACVCLLLFSDFVANFLQFGGEKRLLVVCSLIGMLAGILYCIRGLYVNSGLGKWSSNWCIWYFFRPFTSMVSSFASCIFLKAGLLAFGTAPLPDAPTYGFYALSFVAGYNVDCFMKKIETIACEVWGIDKSRSSTKSSDNKHDDTPTN